MLRSLCSARFNANLFLSRKDTRPWWWRLTVAFLRFRKCYWVTVPTSTRKPMYTRLPIVLSTVHEITFFHFYVARIHCINEGVHRWISSHRRIVRWQRCRRQWNRWGKVFVHLSIMSTHWHFSVLDMLVLLTSWMPCVQIIVSDSFYVMLLRGA